MISLYITGQSSNTTGNDIPIHNRSELKHNWRRSPTWTAMMAISLTSNGWPLNTHTRWCRCCLHFTSQHSTQLMVICFTLWEWLSLCRHEHRHLSAAAITFCHGPMYFKSWRKKRTIMLLWENSCFPTVTPACKCHFSSSSSPPPLPPSLSL